MKELFNRLLQTDYDFKQLVDHNYEVASYLVFVHDITDDDTLNALEVLAEQHNSLQEIT